MAPGFIAHIRNTEVGNMVCIAFSVNTPVVGAWDDAGLTFKEILEYLEAHRG